MSISGSSVHEKIKGKIREVETQSTDLENNIYKIEKSISDLTAERENCYSSLAVHYLPELDAQAIQATLREVREDVEKVFRQKQERRSALEKLMRENREINIKSEGEVDAITAQIEQKAQERNKRLKLIESDLQKDKDYLQRDEEAKKSEVQLQLYKKRIKEVEAEASEKIPAFEKNKIFSYLLRVGYETSDYKRNGLRKTLDSWAVKKVNFAENKKCYDFLKSMPELMKQEVGKRQEELDRVVAEMNKIESRVEKQYGLQEIVTQGEKLMSQRQALIEKDKKEDEQYAAHVRERKDSDSEKDSYHAEAVQKIKGFLKGEQIAELKAKARRTKGTEDDKLVDRVDSIDEEIRGLKNKAKSIKTDRDDVAGKLDKLRSVEKRFRSQDYESSRSYFPDGFDINQLLIGYMLGNMTSHDINSRIDSSQHTKTPSYHSSSDYSSSYTSSHHDSGGFGGSIFSSGGGFGGGGFSSGHGF